MNSFVFDVMGLKKTNALQKGNDKLDDVVDIILELRNDATLFKYFLSNSLSSIAPSNEQMLDEMCAALGGRAAEKVIFNKISTGALSDLEKVTKQARAMVTVYGLNDKVGNLTYYDSSNGNEYGFTKPYSEQTAETIDKEISAIIEKQYQRAISILKKNKKKLIELAEVLLTKEVIFKDNLEEIFGKRPFDKEEPKETKSK